MIDLSVAQAKSKKEDYLRAFELFEKKGDQKSPSWVRQTRKNAIASFSSLRFPTPREENWRYTNVGPIADTSFQFNFGSAAGDLTLKQIEPFYFGEKNWHRLVFVNGSYAKGLSSVSHSQNGLKLTNLEPILMGGSKLAEPYLARYAQYDQNTFTALNTAFIRDGAFIYLPDGKELDQPVHLLFISVAQDGTTISQPRTLIIAGRGSKATIVESYVSLAQDSYFTNAVTEIVLNEGASLDHYKLERESENAFHIGTTQVHQGRNSKFSSSSIAIGGELTRNNLNIGLNAEGAECILNGLYLVSGEQHVDNTTLIDHPKPNGRSRQLYKGILSGKSTAVFSGKIFVHPDAQRTDAQQINKNLLLSEEATVDTRPQLEILANDVKCTHGAAAGQLDEEAIFYLKTRGIGQEEASKLLSYGFANEVIANIQVEAVRTELRRLLLVKLGVPSSVAASLEGSLKS